MIIDINDYSLLILGWLLGILSPAIVTAIKDKREGLVVKKALLAEFEELKFRLLLNVYTIESKHGELNHDFFAWAQSVLVGYKGINSSESLLGTIGPLLKLSKNEMASYTQMTRMQRAAKSGISLKKHSLSMLSANIGILAKFDSVFRGRLLEIKTRLEFLNEMIDEARYYFQLSFQNGITPENYEIANTNMIQTYKFYAARARDIVDMIGKLEEESSIKY